MIAAAAATITTTAAVRSKDDGRSRSPELVVA